MTVERKMPNRLHLGEIRNTPIAGLLQDYEKHQNDPDGENPHGYRMVMGYALPPWQRPIVWEEFRQVRFLESIWRGVPVGTFALNHAFGTPFDNILLDGQQRMHSIQRYLEDGFPVFGYRWSEITEVDRREFTMSRIFPCYLTQSKDEAYLRAYYNLMNFGGVAHTEDQRATR